jgi:hypothetical protein
MLSNTGSTGAVGALPSVGKSILVTGSGASSVPASVLPLAVTKTFHWSSAAFWK